MGIASHGAGKLLARLPRFAVVLSHLHGDHFGGLPFFVLDGQFSGKERPLVAAGPVGSQNSITDATGLYSWSKPSAPVAPETGASDVGNDSG
jgi:ribonuclease BN (tRNA processing enzyme)